VEKSRSGQGVALYTVLRGTAERGNLGGKVQLWPGVALYTVLRCTAERGNLGGKVQLWPWVAFVATFIRVLKITSQVLNKMSFSYFPKSKPW
jgi:hypothetical protein